MIQGKFLSYIYVENTDFNMSKFIEPLAIKKKKKFFSYIFFQQKV